MWILAAMAGAACLLLIRSEYEKRHVSVEHCTLHLQKPLKKDKTMVFLSDLHSNTFGPNQKELLQAIDQVNPDGILIGGDMMITGKKTDRVDVSAALFLVEKLAERYPVYYGYGNHENRLAANQEKYGPIFNDYHRRLVQSGVQFVTGHKAVCLDDELWIRGLDLEPKHYRRGKPAPLPLTYITNQIGRADNQRTELLLAHSPAFFDTYQAWGADITFSGHYHGGTIRLPILGGLMTPQFQFFDPHCAGSFEQNNKHLIVSRGLGTHSINLRLNNRSQLIVIKLKGAKTV